MKRRGYYSSLRNSRSHTPRRKHSINAKQIQINKENNSNGNKTSRIFMIFVVLSLMISSLFIIQQRTTYKTLSYQVPIDDNFEKNNAKKIKLHNDMIRQYMTSDKIWTKLLKEGAALLKSNINQTHPYIAIEVGMHSAKQCLEAARAGFESYCFEPSPHSFSRIERQVARDSLHKSRVHLYNMAASNSTGTPIAFSSEGSTGDHVGDFDMWYMKKRSDNSILTSKSRSNLVTVFTVRLDDVISNITTPTVVEGQDDVFLMKVDTQGFEPSVFAGLTTAITTHKIRYVLFEYWPKAMDLLSEVSVGETAQERCVLSVSLLEQFLAAGYKLFPTPMITHPAAPVESKRAMWNGSKSMDDLRENCEFYYRLEENYPKEDYHMGYWSDMLAVSPTAKMTNFFTDLGYLLYKATA